MIARYFWWSASLTDVEYYVKSWDLCAHIKKSEAGPVGILQPLPIPRILSPLYFILVYHAAKDTQLSFLWLDQDSPFYSLPHCSVCLWNFTSLPGSQHANVHHFRSRSPIHFSVLTGISPSLGTMPLISTVYHPETEGQMERVSQYFHCFLSFHQDDCLPLLCLAQCAYSNLTHASFLANFGFHLWFHLDVSEDSAVPAATDLVFLI